MKIIEVNTGVYQKNDEIAERVHNAFKEKGIFVINLLGTPGSGKTTLLEHLIEHFETDKIAVIEGDLYTDKDARRMTEKGVETVQLNTKGACHLEAAMIEEAVSQLNLKGKELVFIDNIGNLVCTAEFKLGEDIRLTVSSVTEGNDKPGKYPLMFQTTDLLVINKMDLAQYTNFNVEEFKEEVTKLNSDCIICEASAFLDNGIEAIANQIKSYLNYK